MAVLDGNLRLATPLAERVHMLESLAENGPQLIAKQTQHLGPRAIFFDENRA